LRNFDYCNPTRVIFGKGETDRVGKECQKLGKKVLFIYGGESIKQNGLYDRVMRHLREEKLIVYELGGVKPNPRIDKVREGVAICKKEKIDLVLAVGGGSVLDTGKVVAAGALYPGDPWDFFIDEHKISGKIPLVTVLTLAATGSEMNHNAVITNEETLEKLGTHNPHLYPTLSILDPENTYTVPQDQTVNGIADMMAHVFEQYFHPLPETPLQDRWAEGLMKTIIEYTPRVLQNPTDYDGRAVIMWCSTMALNHLLEEAGGGGEWTCHAIEHVLSAVYDIPHGAGLAIIFPQWMKYVLDVIPHKFAQFAERVWEIPRAHKSDKELGLEGIERTREWFRAIGAPTTLKEVGIGEERIPEMARMAVKSGKLGVTKVLDEKDVEEILKMSL